MWTIYKKEIRSYFLTPTGYVFIGVFLLLSGICFGIGNLAARSCDMLSMLDYMSYLWIILCPFLIMRLIAGEQHKKTDKLLFSSPCSISSIVCGKFFSAVSIMLMAVFVTGIYMIIMACVGTLYLAETLAGYLGFILLGCSFIALDLFISCICRSQLTAAVACIGINLILWLADLISSAVSSGNFEKVFTFLSLYRRYASFSLGIISFSDVVFYIAFSALFIFLSVRLIDARRWRDA